MTLNVGKLAWDEGYADARAGIMRRSDRFCSHDTAYQKGYEAGLRNINKEVA